VFLSFALLGFGDPSSSQVAAKGEVAKASLDEIYESVGQFMANAETTDWTDWTHSSADLKSFPGGCD